MKRSFERSTKLPPFRCDLPAFESLVDEVRGALDPEKTSITLSISLENGEQIDFEDFNELRTAPALPAQIHRVRVQLYERFGERKWGLYASDGPAVVRVNGDSAAWCAGLEARTLDFAKRHAVWARSFVENFALAFTGLIAGLSAAPVARAMSGRWIAAQLVGVAIVLYLYFSRNRFFPQFTIDLRKEETALTRRGPTIALVAAVVSAIAAVLQLLLTMK
jgi:hypothetical protein